ncbi:major facilitator superfamily-domain-containing protein [Pseudomassariella vexata]|uniref:Major facilitator superfamily-domain-containing protein n=1 Tax=Pseudomassariella vexata TaxID=1141098 RepID=A0A1Y2EA29_9PEZI|nr:major facilitator superfamily-domain-containing protein [Pseudomassariella vexata]ORY68440.1 major facilitator superfamily-domain-containing protein [Pseudomassariella vexata]
MDDTEIQVPLLAGSSSRQLEEGADVVQPQQYGTTNKNDASVRVVPDDGDSDDGDSDAQGGVQQADAINMVWSKSALVLAYCFIFLCSFAQALQWQIISNLTPYVTSEFSSHSLIPTIGIVSSILSGVLKLPISKIIDAWGRPQGLASVIVLATIGLILMAVCQNVKTYAAAQVFYAVGLSGFSYILTIIVSDTSSMKNRAIAFGFSTSPNLITTFIGPVIARWFYEKSNWRWAFGGSAIMFFLFSLPILVILMMNARKAERLGLLKKEPLSGKSTTQSIRWHLNEYDAIGVVLITVGLTMVLVPISLGTKAENGWDISFLVVGLVLLVAFGFHEKYTATRPVVAFSVLFSRNVAGACLLSIVLFVSYYSWDSYYSSYLQVVHGLSITQAGYIDHIYGFGSCLWAVVVGYLIRVSDRYKWLAWVALPVYFLGGGMMIVFRRPDTHIGFLVLCQILMTIGGSTLVVCHQIAIMVTSTHGELASVMAVLSLASYVGSAGGNTLSGAIWNSTLPKALAELLPNFSEKELFQIGSSLTKQLSYPMGDPVRTAIITAYDRAQVRMCITGSLVSLLQVVAVAIWKDAVVSQVKQVKGKVL